MLQTFRILSIILLLFNGIGACYGGWLLIIDPSGALLQLPIHWLQPSPFNNYFIPGIILFLFNGLSSLIIALLTIIRWVSCATLIFMQGCILTGWIIIQIYLLQRVYFLHYIMGATGLLLMFFGWLIIKKTSGNKKAGSN